MTDQKHDVNFHYNNHSFCNCSSSRIFTAATNTTTPRTTSHAYMTFNVGFKIYPCNVSLFGFIYLLRHSWHYPGLKGEFIMKYKKCSLKVEAGRAILSWILLIFVYKVWSGFPLLFLPLYHNDQFILSESRSCRANIDQYRSDRLRAKRSAFTDRKYVQWSAM